MQSACGRSACGAFTAAVNDFSGDQWPEPIDSLISLTVGIFSSRDGSDFHGVLRWDKTLAALWALDVLKIDSPDSFGRDRAPALRTDSVERSHDFCSIDFLLRWHRVPRAR
jgi:hypothetical protein